MASSTAAEPEYVGWVRAGRGPWEPVSESGSKSVAWDLLFDVLRTRKGHTDASVLPKGTHPSDRPKGKR